MKNLSLRQRKIASKISNEKERFSNYKYKQDIRRTFRLSNRNDRKHAMEYALRDESVAEAYR